MRLIDADALLDFLDVGHLRPPTEICFSELMMKNIIDLQPTVDAVPVIRCRDCAYYSMNGRYRGESKHCVLYVHETHEVNGDDFCSEAERKEE